MKITELKTDETARGERGGEMRTPEIERHLSAHARFLVGEADGARVDLRAADLRGAHLRRVNLRGANLRGANLRAADLRGADLRAVHLRGADLRGADLRGADLRAADLRGANLRGTDLRAADLRGANLSGVKSSVLFSVAARDYLANVNLSDGTLAFGCLQHTFSFWRENLEGLCEEHVPHQVALYEEIITQILDYAEARARLVNRA